MTRPRKRQQRKRCPFCQALFRPDPRLGPRQWACGAPACQRQRHAQNCRAWRRRYPEVTRAHVEIFLSGLRPELRDAIIALGQVPPGVRAP